jgi:phage shock protein A
VGELEQAGVFEDITQLEGGSSEIDRELSQLSQGAQVDEELAKMKAELGSGGDAPALEEGQK